MENFRVPPHSIQAEQALLGGLLMENDRFDEVNTKVSLGDFYRQDHRDIFEAISLLISKSKAADILTVYEALNHFKKEIEITYLNELVLNTPTAANILWYAQIIRDNAILRRLITASDDIAMLATQTNGRAVHDILDDAERRIFSIGDDSRKNQKDLLSINEALVQVSEQLTYLAGQKQGLVTGLSTGFIELDENTTGLQDGDLIIVAGRPSMGKTSFAMNIAEHAAFQLGLPVLVFSLEMSGKQLATRMVGSCGRIDAQRLRTGELSEDEWVAFSQTVQAMNQKPMYIDESSAASVHSIRASARRFARKLGSIRLIVIDYLQLLASDSSDNRAFDIGEMTRGLKALARELSCPVIVLSQLNRGVENRTDKRPRMADLRESGAIEQDADLILFIYRDEFYNPDSNDRGVAEIIIGKQRNGPIGTVRLTFNGRYTRFDNHIPEHAR